MISPETIALIRERADIVAVIGESVALKRMGRVFKACCPFHKEKTPSFNVNPDRNWYHCFGCGEKGDAIDFMMKEGGYTFPEAVRALAERFSIPIDETKQVERGEADRLKKQRDELYAANAIAAAWFEKQLEEHAMRSYAHEELARRGLRSTDDACRAFRIGYAPPGWDGLTSHFRTQSVSPIAAETVGLVAPRQGSQGFYDRFRHRLMFAVIDHHGNVVAFSGRALRAIEEDDGKGPPPKYVNSPESRIYTKGQTLFGLRQARAAIRQQERAVLVEGNFDVVSLHARGIDNVVAPLGTAFTAEQAKLLRRFTSEVTILFDGDGAGRKATRSAREPCREAGLSARVASLPNDVDPDEFVRRRGAAALLELLGGAPSMTRYLLDLGSQDVPTDEPVDLVRVQAVTRLLDEEDNPLIRGAVATYVEKLSSHIKMNGDDFNERVAALLQRLR